MHMRARARLVGFKYATNENVSRFGGGTRGLSVDVIRYLIIVFLWASEG